MALGDRWSAGGRSSRRCGTAWWIDGDGTGVRCCGPVLLSVCLDGSPAARGTASLRDEDGRCGAGRHRGRECSATAPRSAGRLRSRSGGRGRHRARPVPHHGDDSVVRSGGAAGPLNPSIRDPSARSGGSARNRAEPPFTRADSDRFAQRPDEGLWPRHRSRDDAGRSCRLRGRLACGL